jgi:hypothetical protein
MLFKLTVVVELAILTPHNHNGCSDNQFMQVIRFHGILPGDVADLTDVIPHGVLVHEHLPCHRTYIPVAFLKCQQDLHVHIIHWGHRPFWHHSWGRSDSALLNIRNVQSHRQNTCHPQSASANPQSIVSTPHAPQDALRWLGLFLLVEEHNGRNRE